MKRPRRTPEAAPAGFPLLDSAMLAMAVQRLQGDYAAYVSDTAEEDPKRYAARSAAAREALEHLRLLASLFGPQGDAAADPSDAEVLAAARAGMASENEADGFDAMENKT